MNDQEYLNVMSELRFISSVGEGQFINLTTGQIENKNLLTRTIRKFYYKTESGPATAKYCNGVILRAFKLLDRYTCDKDKHSDTHEYAKTIQRYIEEAKIGMDHLKETHKDNNMAFAIFDTIAVAIVKRTNGSSCCGEKFVRED